jgi:hypothetical protein
MPLSLNQKISWRSVCGSLSVASTNSQTSPHGMTREDGKVGISQAFQIKFIHKNLLLATLTDCAPVHLLSRDKWGWGHFDFYSVAQGYNTLHLPQAPNETTTLWKQIWDPLSLPKVNFFNWVIMHKKTLTGKNLEKRGFIGPHRCPMCCQAPEMMEHLFVDYPFAQEVWKISLQGLNSTPLRHILMIDLLSSWKVRYPQETQRSPTWRIIWQAIPKYIFWKLWLARND